MLFLLDNGAHSIKFGHDHESKYFICFFKEIKIKNHTTLPQRVPKRCRPLKGRQADLLRSRDPPLPGQIISPLQTPVRKGPIDSKDIIPVLLAHSYQGLCRRLGRAKGNLGWNVPPIPKGGPVYSGSPDTISNTSRTRRTFRNPPF